MKVELRRNNGKGLHFIMRGYLLGNNTVIECINSKRTLMIKHSVSRMNEGWFKWSRQNALIQDAFPFLDDGEREFLMSGILPEEFDELMRQVEAGE